MDAKDDEPADEVIRQSAERAIAPQNTGKRRLLVIHNPTAGWRRRKRLNAVLAELAVLGCEVRLAETAGPGDAERLARMAVAGGEDVDAIVAAGGDGTVNEVVNGLGDSGRPFGLIPLGTANVLAREIGQQRHARAIARTLAFGPVLRASAGEANGRRFLLMVGAGLDARAVAAANPAIKRALGKGAYVLAALAIWVRGRFQCYRVIVDGLPHEAWSVIVANVRHYGGPYVIAPRARLEQPNLQVCLFQRPGRLAVVRYALALQFGRLSRAPGFRAVSGREVAVTAGNGQDGDGQPVQADGDVMTRLPLDVRILSDAIRLIVPQGYASKRD